MRYPCLSYLIKIWLSVWRHHLANLHILKTWISLERKEIFENNKEHFYPFANYLFVLKLLRFQRCDFRHSGTLKYNPVQRNFSISSLKYKQAEDSLGFLLPSVIFSTKEDVFLLIGEAKYKFVLGGERRTFWMWNSKTSYRNEYSLPNNCVKLSVVDECNTKCSKQVPRLNPQKS